MRTLVLQLARFGDVYQSWPTLRALGRRGDQVHVLVRERFAGALEGLPGVTVHALRTADLLAPILADGDDAAALRGLTAELDHLAGLKFDRIINLSFSPFSSFVTDYLADDGAAEVRGYTRHADGYFTVADDFSAYFYAQVGVGRANRYHVIDLFAGVAGVELTDADFASEPAARDGVVVHLGASQPEKAYPPELWADVLRKLPAVPLTVIGSAAERPLADAVVARCGRGDVTNLVGRTTVAEVFGVLARARLLIGADSAPVQIASLTATPVLNVSCDAVNFWETGPVAAGSRVLHDALPGLIPPGRIADEARAMLDGEGPAGPAFVRRARTESFAPHGASAGDDFAWQLTEALYTGSPYPDLTHAADRTAFRRLAEVAELALAALARWDGPGREAAADQLNLIDELLVEIPRVNPRVRPLTQWFETERLRMGPGDPVATLAKTRALFKDLGVIAAVYAPAESVDQTRGRVVELGSRIAPSLREFDFARVEGEFNELLAGLHELARHSTKVEGWSARVTGLAECLARRDFIEMADQLEFDLPRALQTSGSDVIV